MAFGRSTAGWAGLHFPLLQCFDMLEPRLLRDGQCMRQESGGISRCLIAECHVEFLYAEGECVNVNITGFDGRRHDPHPLESVC